MKLNRELNREEVIQLKEKTSYQMNTQFSSRINIQYGPYAYLA